MPVQPVIPFGSTPLLAALRGPDRAALEPMCRLRGYDKGETVFDEGQPADRIHFVVAGRVKIVKAAGTRDLILEILGPGEPVGAVNKRLADMTGSVDSRAARLFLTLAERGGVARQSMTFIPLALSRQEIADLLGTTLESAIRLMSRWEKEGVIHTERDAFVMADRDALRTAAEA